MDITYDSSKVVPGSNARINQGRVADAASIEAGESVYVDTDGKLDLASALSSAASKAAGIAVNSGSGGQPVDYVYEGDITFVELGSPLTGSLAVGVGYIVSNTPGGIRPASDLGSAEYNAHLGIAKDDSTLTVKLQTPGVATA